MKALVLSSGGVDSTTALGLAVKKYGKEMGKHVVTLCALAVVWLCTGLWHGTGLNYLIWAVWQGGIIALSVLMESRFPAMRAFFHIREDSKGFHVFRMARTFFLAGIIPRIITRAPSVRAALVIMKHCVVSTGMVQFHMGKGLEQYGWNRKHLAIAVAAMLIQLVVSFIIPFIAVVVIGKGFKALKGLVPFILIADVTFLAPQFVVANVIGPDLANIIGAIISMVAMIIAAMKLPMKKYPEFEVKKTGGSSKGLTAKEALVAWSPFILIFIFLLLSSTLVPIIHDPLASINSKISFYAGENPATLTFYWINTPGVLILIAGFIGGLIQGASVGEIFGVLGTTVKNNVKTIITICSVLSVAKIMGYSGMISDIAKVLVAVAGDKFPLISPLIGTIGGFVTGSGTSTTALFGQLQVETAKAIEANPTWLAAANLMGAGIGKMICPQSIAIGTAACGLTGAESKILGKCAAYTLLFAAIGGIVCFVFPMIGLV